LFFGLPVPPPAGSLAAQGSFSSPPEAAVLVLAGLVLGVSGAGLATAALASPAGPAVAETFGDFSENPAIAAALFDAAAAGFSATAGFCDVCHSATLKINGNINLFTVEYPHAILAFPIPDVSPLLKGGVLMEKVLWQSTTAGTAPTRTLEGRRPLPIVRRNQNSPTRITRMASKTGTNEGGKGIKKVVLAYSGGLDTSIILKWLQETYNCEVVTFTADLGQGEELEPARKKAELLGIKKENIFIEDLREEFVRDYVFPMFRANAVYEGVYLLGTSIARPLIGKKQIEIARKTGADAVCHGATGKGNDQVRFELSYYALEPGIKIIAPWREWSFKGREDLIEFARKNQIPVAKDKEGESPFSVDANLLHSSSEGKVLEDPANKAPEIVYQRTISPMAAPDRVTTITVGFSKGDAVSINGKALSPATLLKDLNDLGRDNGIGRLDLVENRFVGMKSRGVYETPGGTILLAAHRAMESVTLDRGAAHLKDELMPRYAELIYNGFWFSPERDMLQALIDKSQENVEGDVTLELYKGNVIVVGRKSAKSLYSPTLVTFEDDKGAYDQKDAQGFIKLNALRLRTLAARNMRKT
jgi:argininosuccinate synthase